MCGLHPTYVTGFTKMCIEHTSINIQKFYFEILNVLYLKTTCVHTNGSLVDQLFNKWLVELPAILNSSLHKVVNTTSTPIGVEGGG